jgi:hypothetical protein
MLHGLSAAPALVVLVVLLWPGTASTGSAMPRATEHAEWCVAELRGTDDGQRVEAFLTEIVDELSPSAAGSLGDPSLWLHRLIAAVEPSARVLTHTRVHIFLGNRLDEETHAAIHNLMDGMVACIETEPS